MALSSMSQPLCPMITVCSGDIRRTYPPSRDVIVGRDVRADIRIPHPAISRAHVILRCVDGDWTAIDNDSRNGMFVGAERVKSVAAGDRTVVNLGNPEGPALSFELGPPPDERPTVETGRPAVRWRSTSWYAPRSICSAQRSRTSGWRRTCQRFREDLEKI